MACTQHRCPYQVLGVSRESSEDEIKKSYRKLAILHHPDKNQGKPEATEMFQQIGAAYAILSSPEKRRHYDMTGSLDEDDMQEADMDDMMQMFFQAFGGGGMMFGGAPMMFEFQTGKSRRSHHHFSGNQMFSSLFHEFESDEEDDDDDEDFDFISGHPVFEDDQDDLEDQLLEVLPALFCQHFIEEQEHKNRLSFKCTLCDSILRTTDAAEFHYMEKHQYLMNRFVEILEKASPEDEIMSLFSSFADQVQSGKISEKKKKKSFTGPKVRRSNRRHH